jgi:hypothetical protein
MTKTNETEWLASNLTEAQNLSSQLISDCRTAGHTPAITMLAFALATIRLDMAFPARTGPNIIEVIQSLQKLFTNKDKMQ